MQSGIILAIMALVSVFILSEANRSNTREYNLALFKTENVAANLMQYQDLMVQYILSNYNDLHVALSGNSGKVEQIKEIDYEKNNVTKYSQKDLSPFLNYKTIVFNYVNSQSIEDVPLLYLATTFESFTDQVVYGYKDVSLSEVMGRLGYDLSKHLYQGNSTYWVVPWLFSQNNCSITEVYSPLPPDADGNSQLDKLKILFNLFCSQIEANSGYKFMHYVYMSPVYNPSDI